MAYIIGKADTMYTLWYEETFQQNGKTRTKVSFIKNLSKDLETAKSMYPGVPVDETLRGTKWIIVDTPKYEPPKEIDPTKFPFGKYRGMNVVECTDIDYIVWFYWNAYEKMQVPYEPKGYDELVKNLEKRAADFDYFPWKGNLLPKDEYTEHVTAPERFKAFKEALLATDTIEGVMENNPSLEYPSQFEFNGFTVRVRFKENQVAGYMYQGFPYYLPLVNGKAKRVKGKNVRIKFTNIEFDVNPDDPYYSYANVDYVSLEVIK